MNQEVAGTQNTDTEIKIIGQKRKLRGAIHQDVERIDAPVKLTLLIISDPLGDRRIHGHFSIVGINHDAVHDGSDHRKSHTHHSRPDDLSAQDGEEQGDDHKVLQNGGELHEVMVSQPCVDHEKAVARACEEKGIKIKDAEHRSNTVSFDTSNRQRNQNKD